ncbi:hypothetical protein INR49_006274 [Caranx melampygus]|nr:hypothetical protein INR49_006274 [Caranx melampygus]
MSIDGETTSVSIPPGLDRQQRRVCEGRAPRADSGNVALCRGNALKLAPVASGNRSGLDSGRQLLPEKGGERRERSLVLLIQARGGCSRGSVML